MRAAVLISGGVDSSVALRLAQKEGYDVTAFYLKIWLEDELSYLGSCPWEEDLSYARAVCEQAGVPLEVVSFQQVYWGKVVTYLIDEIKAGRTPNPDMLCNQYVKFGAFLDQFGDQFDKVITGHYARVCEHILDSGVVEYHLYSTPDTIKDQTYFLARLNQKQLAKAYFPLGEFTKDVVRKLAQEYDLCNKNRKDSQGICFLGKFSFADFLKHHVGTRTGVLREFETGRDVGEHGGFWYYTIGQRHSIGLSGGPWYVVAKDTQQNIVYISRDYYSQDKQRKNLIVSDVSFIGTSDLSSYGSATVHVKLRHGPKLVPAHVFQNDGFYTIELGCDDQGIAPGQFAVFYDKERCIGSGIIT